MRWTAFLLLALVVTSTLGWATETPEQQKTQTVIVRTINDEAGSGAKFVAVSTKDSKRYEFYAHLCSGVPAAVGDRLQVPDPLGSVWESRWSAACKYWAISWL